MQGIEADEPAGEFEPGAELAHDGDLVGFFRGDLAAQIVQAGGGDRGDDVLSATVLGLEAVATARGTRTRETRLRRCLLRTSSPSAR